MPYITETISKEYFGLKELQLSSAWPKKSELQNMNIAITEINFLIDLMTELRIIRSELNIAYKTKLDLLINNSENKDISIIYKYEKIISNLAKLASIKVTDDNFPKGSALGVINKLSIAIPLSDTINITDELNRLKKEIDKIQKDIDKLESNLNNSNFLDRAPENIVNDIKSRLLLNQDKKAKLEDSINRLNY